MRKLGFLFIIVLFFAFIGCEKQELASDTENVTISDDGNNNENNTGDTPSTSTAPPPPPPPPM